MKKLLFKIALFFCITALITGCSDNSQPSATTVSPGGASQSSESASPSGQEASASAMMTIKPKQLISKEDAVKLLGESMKEGIEDEQKELGISSCFYAPEAAGSKSYLQVTILQKPSDNSGGQQSGGQQSGSQQSGGQQSGGQQSGSQQSGGQQSGGQQSGSQQSGKEMTPKKIFEAIKKVFADPNAAVTGFVGDDKFMTSQGICLVSSEYCIYVAVGNADPATAKAIISQAAELAFGNLKRVQGK